jgi:dUTP pyrophosphatase
MNTDLNSLREQAENLNKYLNDNFDDESFEMLLNETGLDIKKLEQDMMSYTPKLNLKYKKLNPEAKDPFYNYPSDSGFDLYATQTVYITKFGRALVPTGLSFDIKDGYEIQVRSKSGLAINQGLMVLNSPGTVDSGYLGEVKVILFNVNNHEVKINKGMKVAQAVLSPVVNGKWVSLEERNEINEKDRGSNGFGSTGI